jgi:hypothetical protein
LLFIPQSSIDKQVSNILKLLFELLRTPKRTILKFMMVIKMNELIFTLVPGGQLQVPSIADEELKFI